MLCDAPARAAAVRRPWRRSLPGRRRYRAIRERDLPGIHGALASDRRLNGLTGAPEEAFAGQGHAAARAGGGR